MRSGTDAINPALILIARIYLAREYCQPENASASSSAVLLTTGDASFM